MHCKDCKHWKPEDQEDKRTQDFSYGVCKNPKIKINNLTTDPVQNMIYVHDPYVGWDCRSDFGCIFFENRA